MTPEWCHLFRVIQNFLIFHFIFYFLIFIIFLVDNKTIPACNNYCFEGSVLLVMTSESTYENILTGYEI